MMNGNKGGFSSLAIIKRDGQSTLEEEDSWFSGQREPQSKAPKEGAADIGMVTRGSAWLRSQRRSFNGSS